MVRFGTLIVAGLFAASSAAFAQEAADGGVSDAGPPLSPDDAKLLQQIEAAQAAQGSQPKAAAAPAPTNAPSDATAPAPADKGKASSFFSNIYNPAMSVNGLFLGTMSSQDKPPPGDAQSGIAIQEMEVQILANVDPYLSANVVFSMPGGSTFGVEEGWLALTAQPLGLGLRAGQLKVPFGRENPVHTHALPFVDRSLIGTAVFGDGLDEVGVEATWLVPVSWYLLFTAEVLNGDNPVAFNSPNGRDLAYFGALKNVVDLSDDTTAELGAQYVAGENGAQELSQVAGAHLVLKWKPAAFATTRSGSLTIEGMYSHVPSPEHGNSPDTWGLYSYGQWQLAQRWFIGGRYEYLHPAGDQPVGMRESGILAFAPSEFSAFRLQLNLHQPGGGLPQVFEAFLQANFTLGAHPAHSY